MAGTMSIEMPPTPEHDKLTAHKAEHEAIVAFLHWLDSDEARFFNVCARERYRGEDRWFPCSDGQRAQLIADYFDVDPDALEAEKRAMLDAIRKANAGAG